MVGTRPRPHNRITTVTEISVILKNNILITNEEFGVLNKYSSKGKIWKLVHQPTAITPYVVKCKVIEYIFYPEDLTVFCIFSRNILATWDTSITRYFKPAEEFQLTECLFIKLLG